MQHRSWILALDAELRGFFQLHLGWGSFPQAWGTKEHPAAGQDGCSHLSLPMQERCQQPDSVPGNV